MVKDLVSVIIPTYNRAYILKDSLNTVLNQTYKNIEVLIIDDCSIDNTKELIDSINDKRIKYYKLEKRSRACGARNFGMNVADGEYVAFEDSDDMWHLDKLEKQVKFIKDGGYDFVFCGMNRTNSEGYKYYVPSEIDMNISLYKQELNYNRIPTPGILMKNEVAKSIKFDTSLNKYEDWDFSIQACRDYKVGYLAEALIDSEMQKDSISVLEDGFFPTLTIYKKYEKDMEADKTLKARFMIDFANAYRNNNTKKAAYYFKELLKCKFSLKVFIKYLLSSMGIKY